MATPEYDAQVEPQPLPCFEVWDEKIVDETFRHLDRKFFEIHIKKDDVYIGMLNWDWMGPKVGQSIVIDDLYPHDGQDQEVTLSSAEWNAVAVCMHGVEDLRDIRRIDHPGGQNLFLEAV